MYEHVCTGLTLKIPENRRTGRFFLIYDPKAKIPWTKRPLGKGWFGKQPNLIATALGLPKPEQFTGHAFRGACTLVGLT